MYINSELLVKQMIGLFPVPHNLNNYSIEEFPYWHVFKILHLGSKLDLRDILHNERIIAALEREEILSNKLDYLLDKGVIVQELDSTVNY